jgi:heme exporter protein D
MSAFFGEHGGFILASYAAASAVITGLVARAVLEHRRRRRELEDLEARGLRRRSEWGA